MARKYTVETIDGVKYGLHKVKADDKAIGSVPVRMFSPDNANQDFIDFVGNANQDEIELIIADWQYGNAVRLQGLARKCVSGEGFSDAAMNKAYAAMTPEECAQFHQDHAALVKYCKQKWADMQADGAADVDADKVWEELL